MEEGMHIVENRVASFMEAKFAWPHPDTFGVVPLNLAEAGFYFDPQSKEDDSCVCFLCHKSLGGWEEEDNPVTEHISHAPYCAWAKLLCSRLYVESSAIPLKDFAEDEYLPTSSAMEAARAATFQEFWPHENKKGWLCNVKKMAKAGFHYNPTPDSDDTTCCIYCNTTLDGWEPRDSPVKEHRKRAPTCPFFVKDLKNTLKKTTSSEKGAEEVETKVAVSRSSTKNEKPQPQLKPKSQRGVKAKKEVKAQPEASPTTVVKADQDDELPPAIPERRARGGRKRKADTVAEEITPEENDVNTSTNDRTIQSVGNKTQPETKSKSRKTRRNEQVDTKTNTPEECVEADKTRLLETQVPPSPQVLNERSTGGEETTLADVQSHKSNPQLGTPTSISDSNLDESSPDVDGPLASSLLNKPRQPSNLPQDEQNNEMMVWELLSDDERNMSVEQFMRSLIDKQVKKLQSESEQKIAQFMQEAEKIKDMIIAMD
ncbi:inhibitor of apoptosis repeat-containing protein [Basidiobolus meristosporus CBS 931.73]|uniref:Inhibitor of apoptosis repeat-containing protein n=1 Tax=Basidiobolus meristosporus CBS 931.73 TaxID=1314790 RepID=A0A1Y1XXM8_9FUNG|nr:inhibitor of apoptosis repeat-containing protein [Basidiobolus meristosporus CBS 931.73]|eukprot:ORX90114.1 inhibitor of apoptosis repeat-containing protein [Basidiobolus meristosporus CBS 931.73]